MSQFKPAGTYKTGGIGSRAPVSGEIFSELINLAGRQRMLSQRIVLHAVLASLKQEKAAETARAALVLFRDSHATLVQGKGNLPGVFFDALRSAYFGDIHGDKTIMEFIDLAERTLRASETGTSQAPVLLAELVTHIDPMLQLLNRITVIYEDESRRHALAMKKHLHAVMNDIQTIAKRARIVSFNAQIVAAGAGDAGRGFAVVAGELTKITGEIDKLVQAALSGEEKSSSS